MADPTKYTPSYNFSSFQAQAPATPLPGPQVDIQLQEIKAAVDSTVDAIKSVRRSDGALKNGVVTADSLASSLVIGFTLRGTWVVDTAYMAGDGVIYDEIFYKSRVAHTSAAETRPDLDADTWEFLTSMAAISVTDGSITPAKLADAQEDGFLAKIGVWAKLGALIAGGTGKTTPVDADTIPLSDSAASDATKKLTWANLKATVLAALGTTVAALTGKTTPVDADTLVLSDSEAAGAGKSLTWTNLKAALLTYFNGVYAKPGSVVQSVAGTYATNASITTVIPNDTSIPQIGEGTEIISVNITPTSATNLLRIRLVGTVSGVGANLPIVFAAFLGATANAFAADEIYTVATDVVGQFALIGDVVAGVTTAVAVSIRVGPGSAGTIRFNGNTSSQHLGASRAVRLVVEEIQV